MIVVDTSGMLALLDQDDRAHASVLEVFRVHRDDWVLPWAILPELDHMALAWLGSLATAALRADLADGRYHVAWGRTTDLRRAQELDVRYRDLRMGLVDGVVMALAERLQAWAIVTLDLRDFGAVQLKGNPQIWPRDLRHA